MMMICYNKFLKSKTLNYKLERNLFISTNKSKNKNTLNAQTLGKNPRIQPNINEKRQ